jgi:hypothetical protein
LGLLSVPFTIAGIFSSASGDQFLVINDVHLTKDFMDPIKESDFPQLGGLTNYNLMKAMLKDAKDKMKNNGGEI